MFGMLDYRAHKLYLALFFFPFLVIHTLEIFGIPVLVLGAGQAILSSYPIFENDYLLFFVSLIAFCFLWLLTGPLWAVVEGFAKATFRFLIDVVPHDGRSDEEAWEVVAYGQKAMTFHMLKRSPKTWTTAEICDVPKIDWVANKYYREKTIQRLILMRAKSDEFYDRDSMDKLQKEINSLDYGDTIGEIFLSRDLEKLMSQTKKGMDEIMQEANLQKTLFETAVTIGEVRRGFYSLALFFAFFVMEIRFF